MAAVLSLRTIRLILRRLRRRAPFTQAVNSDRAMPQPRYNGETAIESRVAAATPKFTMQ
jgi:hypothetical protein